VPYPDGMPSKPRGKRVTPKGTRPGAPVRKRTRGPTPRGGAGPKGGAAADAPSHASGRYTPPIPREQRVSPTWVPVLMFTLLGLGTAVIILNYLGLLPGAQNNLYLLLGLGMITGGFITATQYH
jgi:hypothetical protein